MSEISSIQCTIQALWRMESAKVTATLARKVKDVALAEDFAQEALLAAMEQWPREGIPDNPRAWLIAVGKRRTLDHFRHMKMSARHEAELSYHLELHSDNSFADHEFIIKDDLLKLIFSACHPAVSAEGKAALALRVLCGLTVEEIARAFLISETAVSQRIVRAKRTLAEAKVPFEVPGPSELPARLQSVLEVIYLLFNEGNSATSSENWLRADLCEDALRIGRVLVSLMPNEPEVHGIVALMEIQASRFAARFGPNGEPILLRDQNRSLWDRLLISRGIAALAKAEKLFTRARATRGPITLQAAIAAEHARARSTEDTDWSRILALYDELLALTKSPVVALNRAVAVSMVYGAAAGLVLIDQIKEDRRLENHHLLPSVRADFLFQLARYEEAGEEFIKAASMAQNIREKELLLSRARGCESKIGAQKDP